MEAKEIVIRSQLKTLEAAELQSSDTIYKTIFSQIHRYRLTTPKQMVGYSLPYIQLVTHRFRCECTVRGQMATTLTGGQC